MEGERLDDRPAIELLAKHAKAYLEKKIKDLEKKIKDRKKGPWELFEAGLMEFGESCRFGAPDRRPFWRTLNENRKESMCKLLGNCIIPVFAPVQVVGVGLAAWFAAPVVVAAGGVGAVAPTLFAAGAAAPAAGGAGAASVVAGKTIAVAAGAAGGALLGAGVVTALDHGLDTPEKSVKLIPIEPVSLPGPEFDGAAIERIGVSMWLEPESTPPEAPVTVVLASAAIVRPGIESGVRFFGGRAAAAAVAAASSTRAAVASRSTDSASDESRAAVLGK